MWSDTNVARGPRRESVPYRILIRGDLPGGVWGMPGLSLSRENGYCVITGDMADQSHLVAVIEWLADRGAHLISFAPCQRPEAV